MKFTTEIEVVELLRDFMRNNGYQTSEEVSSMGQSIDLVARKNRWVYAFEAKRDNWKRGLMQCRAHELIADYVCLAVGSKSISDALNREIQTLGYGLVWCNPESRTCSWVHTPKLNKNVWRPQKRMLLKTLKEHA